MPLLASLSSVVQRFDLARVVGQLDSTVITLEPRDTREVEMTSRRQSNAVTPDAK
jgi:hypothetical protein